jgi:hypothetical protein
MPSSFARVAAFVLLFATACGGSTTAGNTGGAGGGGGQGAGGATSSTSSDTGSATATQSTTTSAAACTSMHMGSATGPASPTHDPGLACLACHQAQQGPTSAAAGTVYPALHEVDECWGVSGTTDGVTVEITDASGKLTVANVNAAGNFTVPLSAALAMPITAVVKKGGLTRAKTTPVSSGDCNGCHSVAGENGAPGRIMTP